MLCVPALRPLVGHAAMRVLPAPVSASAPQPLIVLPPSVKFRVPVGPLPVTDAVNVTPVPTVDGFAELDRAVVAAALTTCDNGELLDAVLAPSPEYAATMVCVPELNAGVLHAAVRVFPAPVSATAPQPLMVAPPSMKFTLPVGAVPVTDAVKVTLAPTVEGSTELTSVVVVAVPPPGAETERVSAPAGPVVTPVTVTLMLYVASV